VARRASNAFNSSSATAGELARYVFVVVTCVYPSNALTVNSRTPPLRPVKSNKGVKLGMTEKCQIDSRLWCMPQLRILAVYLSTGHRSGAKASCAINPVTKIEIFKSGQWTVH
jgi:hypothetical protein